MGLVKNSIGSIEGGFFLGITVVVAVATYYFTQGTFPILNRGGNGTNDPYEGS